MTEDWTQKAVWWGFLGLGWTMVLVGDAVSALANAICPDK